MSDFHVLLYLYGLNCFDIKMKTQMDEILEAVRNNNKDLANKFMSGDTWRTFEQLIGAHEHDNHMENSAVGNGSDWVCNHCTYINATANQSCEMCSLPR